MQYLGGKSRIAKDLAELIDSIREPGQWVWDAFCGGLSMSVALSKKGPVLSTDANAALINLYLAVQQGWDPPSVVTREEYAAAKALPDTDPRKAFIGFACAFAGKWFGGYASNNSGTNYAAQGRTAVRRKVAHLSRVASVNFLAQEPRPVSALLYLDPPYAGTTGYAGAGAFDSDAFAKRCVEWAAFAHVFVSEYQMPVGHCVWERTQKTTVNAGLSGAGIAATERLYYLPKGSRW